MLFYIVRLSHHYEFEVQHALSNQSFFRLSLDHHHALPGAHLGCGVIIYFISASALSFHVLVQLLKKKIMPSAEGMDIDFLIKNLQNFQKQRPNCLLLDPFRFSFFVHTTTYLRHGHRLT